MCTPSLLPPPSPLFFCCFGSVCFVFVFNKQKLTCNYREPNTSVKRLTKKGSQMLG